MGFHICTFCKPGQTTRYPNTSSGDVTLVFDSGRSWQMPDMILHYVEDHGWKPPEDFIQDVMHSKLTGGERQQTKGLVAAPTRIGYLDGPFDTGTVPEGFVYKLESLMHQADRQGQRIQYRGA